MFVGHNGLGGSGSGEPDFLEGYGNALNNVITGAQYEDALYGRGGDDKLLGNSGNDRLEGGDGNDLLDGGSGADYMYGGNGDDTYVVDNVGDTAVDALLDLPGNGNDTVHASMSYTIQSNTIENLTLTGTDHLLGTGNDAANVLKGNSGNNELKGRAGDDTLIGGGGADLLYGGDGWDTFDYNRTTDSTPGSQHDVIADFQGGAKGPFLTFDVIDVRDIDANPGVAGDQAFTWIGSAAFSGIGQMRYADGMLQASVDADAAPEFEIELTGAPTLVMSTLEQDVLL